MKKDNFIKTDTVIVGSGVAGLFAALCLPKEQDVLVITKENLDDCDSFLAQGGVCVLKDINDFDCYFEDTMKAGHYENNPESVRVMIESSQDVIGTLIDLGVKFDTDGDGEYDYTREGAHRRNRILHHKDETGKEITATLLDIAKTKPNITFVTRTTMIDLIEKDNMCYGIVCYDEYGEKGAILADNVILATGGIGRVYKYTTNSAIATGDGIAFAYMLGARIKNLSRIQFHPTAFAADHGRERFLISEAVRGEGAVLLNCNGERFASNYDSRGELAPRDVVSNAVMLESIKTNSENFYLDITHKPADFVRNRFPMIYERCLEEGVDITKDRIPVFPCQHYLMGGIDVDLHSRTTVEGLYAAGECSHTGVHGANRLASNSLLEALVYSRTAALDITDKINKFGRRTLGEEPVYRPVEGKTMPHGCRSKIREILQDAYFVLPKPEKYEESSKQIHEIMSELFAEKYEINSDLVEARSAAIVASIIFDEIMEGTD